MVVIIVKEKSSWILYNKSGTKVLGKFRTKKEAVEREKEINYFKNKGDKK